MSKTSSGTTLESGGLYHCADSNGLKIGDGLVCYWGQAMITIPVAEDGKARRPDRRTFIRDNLVVEIEGQTLLPDPDDGKWKSRGFSWDDKKRVDRLLAQIDDTVCNGAAVCKPKSNQSRILVPIENSQADTFVP